jgi:homocysteine S-methyltransferase
VPDPLQQLLDRQSVVILDGGLATELETRGVGLDDQLWSAALLVDNPGSLAQVHRDYLEAGADCIVSASYQATLQGFKARGLDSVQAEATILKSVDLARSARDQFWAECKRSMASSSAESVQPESLELASGRRLRPLVGASVGPYGAYLADGSEFTGAYDLDEEGLFEFHRDRWELLANSGADLMACETFPSIAEARALVRLFELTPWIGGWVSFSCRNEHDISDGTDLAKAVETVASSPEVLAIGINCTAPRYISPLLERARSATDKPLAVYPNSGETWDAKNKCWIDAGTRFDLATAAEEWVALGARLIGGCCRTGPEDIKKLRERLL